MAERSPQYHNEFFDAYNAQWFIQKSDGYKALERTNRITGVDHDIAFASTLIDNERYAPYRKLLFETVNWTLEVDGFITPSSIKTDYKRALRGNHAKQLGCDVFDTVHFIRAFVNDHVVTVLMRYIVAEDVDRYHDFVQLNHADCDIYLCMLDKRFKWLLDDRCNEAEPGSVWEKAKAEYSQLDFFDIWDGAA